MDIKFASIALGILHLAAAMPAITLQDLEVSDDTMSVGSYVRETRAAPPEDFDRSFQSEGDGEIGYSRKKSGGGKKGYQHFDSYHKKAGDHYEFEKQDSFGHEKEGQAGAHSHRHEQRAEKSRKPPAADDYEAQSRESIASRQEITHEELKDGAPDGNGGIESFGHDPEDYVLPERYIFGGDGGEKEEKADKAAQTERADDEYDF